MKKKKLLNRLLSALLAVIMAIGLIPMGSVTVKAETKNMQHCLTWGALGTVKIGSKSESGTWYRTEVAGTRCSVWIWERHAMQAMSMKQ